MVDEPIVTVRRQWNELPLRDGQAFVAPSFPLAGDQRRSWSEEPASISLRSNGVRPDHQR